MTVFDDALQKRFDEAPLITAIEVTSNDTLLIRDLETGQVMRIPVSVFYSALGSAFASLVDGKVPASQLPSYVDDVLEYANLAAFPGTGETGKIYVAIDTNKTYRWSGSAYVEISASLALGETSSTAYRGDRGKTAYDHSQLTTGNPHGTTKADLSLSNVDNTSDANKPVSTAQATAINAKANKSGDTFTGDLNLQGGFGVVFGYDQAGGGSIRYNVNGDLDFTARSGYYVNLNSPIKLSNQNTASSASSGASSLPSNPVGFISAVLNGTAIKIPYYAN